MKICERTSTLEKLENFENVGLYWKLGKDGNMGKSRKLGEEHIETYREITEAEKL